MFYEMIKYKAREAEHSNNNNNIEKYNKPNNGMRLDFVNVSTWQIAEINAGLGPHYPSQ